jgi:hypothetical protein
LNTLVGQVVRVRICLFVPVWWPQAGRGCAVGGLVVKGFPFPAGVQATRPPTQHVGRWHYVGGVIIEVLGEVFDEEFVVKKLGGEEFIEAGTGSHARILHLVPAGFGGQNRKRQP